MTSSRPKSCLTHSRPSQRLLSGLLVGLVIGLASCQASPTFKTESGEELIPNQGGVSQALNTYLLNQKALTGSPYEDAYQDLDNDGIDDALVILKGPDWCGLSGCPLLIFRGTSDGNFLFLSRTEKVRQPVLLSESRTNGWRDLIIGTTLKGRPEDVLLNYGLEGYPTDARVGERVVSLRNWQTVSAF